MFAKRVADLLGQIGAVVVHGQQDAFDLDIVVERGANAFKRRDQLGDAFEGKIFGLHGHNERVGSHQDIKSEQIKGGRAVENHEVVFISEGARASRRRTARSSEARQLDIGAGEVLRSGQKPEILDSGWQE